MADVLVLPLPDGGCIALDTVALAAARARAAELGFGRAQTAEPSAASGERWLTSQELAAATGIGDTTWEALAKRGEVPHLRCGKALRFLLSEVRAALQEKGR